METATFGRKRRRKNEDSSAMSDERSAKKPLKDASPILQLFQGFQTEIDSRHDKYERIVKCSRDITTQSKRVIFLLHRGLDEKSRAKILEEAAGKFVAIKELFKKIAADLLYEDCYQFVRAYSPGLQEFVEAYSFWYFLKHGTLVSFEQICKELVFGNASESTKTEQVKPHVHNPPDENIQVYNLPDEDIQIPNPPTENTHVPNPPANIQVPIPPAEYILGISDLTGELMRLAINSVGQGNLTTPLEICKILRKIHDEFITFGNRQRGFPKKLEVLKNSLKKVENTCYTIHIRGSEVPKNMLATLIASNTDPTVDGQ
jgi:predicted translin family RNA/ssDNA-binding protein